MRSVALLLVRVRETPRLKVRPARVRDVPAIHDLVGLFADRKLMVRRTLPELYESVREFVVAVDDADRILGCAALHIFGADLAELRAVAVADELQGRGVGRDLTDACGEAARDLGITSVFALTHAVAFFEKCGYRQIDKSELPHHIWDECVRCPAFPHCEETALIKRIPGS
jgi:amino-acid N-acetyltransferase